MTLPRPRRITPTSPLGSLLKHAAPIPRPAKCEGERDADYLAMVRDLPCLKCGMEPSEAAHVRYASAAFGKSSGLQKKPEDRFAVSLCSQCHRLARDAQHNRNEQEFWHDININPLLVAEKLYHARADLVTMRAVVLVAISERRR
jgi:hypothetical protein